MDENISDAYSTNSSGTLSQLHTQVMEEPPTYDESQWMEMQRRGHSHQYWSGMPQDVTPYVPPSGNRVHDLEMLKPPVDAPFFPGGNADISADFESQSQPADKTEVKQNLNSHPPAFESQPGYAGFENTEVKQKLHSDDTAVKQKQPASGYGQASPLIGRPAYECQQPSVNRAASRHSPPSQSTVAETYQQPSGREAACPLPSSRLVGQPGERGSYPRATVRTAPDRSHGFANRHSEGCRLHSGACNCPSFEHQQQFGNDHAEHFSRGEHFATSFQAPSLVSDRSLQTADWVKVNFPYQPSSPSQSTARQPAGSTDQRNISNAAPQSAPSHSAEAVGDEMRTATINIISAGESRSLDENRCRPNTHRG
jgi:hypothetical protein